MAFVSTNIDGYALLLGFFGNARYRTFEIALGQYASITVQLILSIAITQSGWGRNAPLIGLAGIVPVLVGLRRIVALRWRDDTNMPGLAQTVGAGTDRLARIATVTAVATAGAADNVMAYTSLLVGRQVSEDLFVVFIFGVLTGVLCLCARMTARSRVSIAALQWASRCVVPFVTTGIGISLLIRFDTLEWIYSAA